MQWVHNSVGILTRSSNYIFHTNNRYATYIYISCVQNFIKYKTLLPMSLVLNKVKIITFTHNIFIRCPYLKWFFFICKWRRGIHSLYTNWFVIKGDNFQRHFNDFITSLKWTLTTLLAWADLLDLLICCQTILKIIRRRTLQVFIAEMHMIRSTVLIDIINRASCRSGTAPNEFSYFPWTKTAFTPFSICSRMSWFGASKCSTNITSMSNQ